MSGEVLYITYDGLLEPLGASQVIPYVERAASAGIEVTVLSFEKPVDLSDLDRVKRLEDRLSQQGIRWARRRYHARPTLLASWWDVQVGRAAVRRWVGRRSGRLVIHARGYLPALMGLAGKPTAQLLFDMRGFWVDERIEGGYWAPDGVEVRVGRWIERKALAGADHLISLTARGAARIGDLHAGAATKPVSVIPTCVRTDVFTPPVDRAELRTRLGVADVPVLIHVGTISGWYDGAATMAVAKEFISRTGGQFLILTRDLEAARRLTEGAGVEALIQSAAPEAVPDWVRAADAGLALVRTSPSKDASFATKVGEYLACGLAVLGTGIGDMKELADGDVLDLLDGRSPEEAASWLATAAASPTRQARARALAQERLSVDVGATDLVAVYEQMLTS